MKTLLIGLGNPILGDDGVGWRVVENVKSNLDPGSQVVVECLSLGGISLMEHLIGCRRVILVDAFISDDNIGSLFVYKLDEIPNYSAFHVSSAHDMTLQSAIELGKWMGAILPDEITVVGIATRRIIDFSEELSPPVAQAIPRVTEIVLDLLKQIVKIPQARSGPGKQRNVSTATASSRWFRLRQTLNFSWCGSTGQFWITS